jgi:hypothetical protein
MSVTVRSSRGTMPLIVTTSGVPAGLDSRPLPYTAGADPTTPGTARTASTTRW